MSFSIVDACAGVPKTARGDSPMRHGRKPGWSLQLLNSGVKRLRSGVGRYGNVSTAQVPLVHIIRSPRPASISMRADAPAKTDINQRIRSPRAICHHRRAVAVLIQNLFAELPEMGFTRTLVVLSIGVVIPLVVFVIVLVGHTRSTPSRSAPQTAAAHAYFDAPDKFGGSK